MTLPTKINTNVRSMKEIVGGGYGKAWNYRGRYLAIKGGRGSKKSKTMALRWMKMLKQYESANLLVIRQVFKDLRDSAFADLEWAAHQLDVHNEWHFKVSPLEIVNVITGQKILFRGLDKPMSVTSITVTKGQLCWCWMEEAYQIHSEDAFDKIDMSIRGRTDVFKQIVVTLNPWNDKHWIKRRFFDVEDEDILAMTTTYQCNEFLDEADLKLFRWMKENRPRRYRIEGEGHWGISEGVIFDNWRVEEFNHQDIAKIPDIKSAFGIDFGYTADPTAFISALVDMKTKRLYIFDEHSEQGMLTSEIADMVKRKGYAKEMIVADGQEKRLIEELRRSGISRIVPARKLPHSIIAGIQFLQDFEIIVHPACHNVQVEFENYVWKKDKVSDKQINEPIDEYNHLIDALRYAVEYLHVDTKKRREGRKLLY